jgi:hypothetical protein
MRRQLSLAVVLVGAVALATGACTSSGGNDNGQKDAGGDVFHQFDGGPQQDSGGGDAPVSCTSTGFTAAAQSATADPSNMDMLYIAKSSATDPTDQLQIELYYGLGDEPLRAPGTVTIGAIPADRNYATCTTCVRLRQGCTTGSGCTGKIFLATQGTITVTEFASGGNFVGTMSNVKLQEVTIASDYTSTPVTNGAWWCLDSYSFSSSLVGTLPCASNTDCPSDKPLCDTDASTCGECLTNADCASKPAGQQLCGAGICGACATALDCTTAATPWCQLSATTGKPECVAGGSCTGDDGAEPGDDGPSGARLLTVGVGMTGNICQPADVDEWDFYKIVTTAAGNITITVSWADAGTDLDFYVWDSTFAGVDSAEGTTNPETLALTAQPAGTYYVGVLNYDPGTATSAVPYTITYTTP